MSYGSWNVYCPCEGFSLSLLGSMKTAPNNIGTAGRLLRLLEIGSCPDRIQKACRTSSSFAVSGRYRAPSAKFLEQKWVLGSCFATLRFRMPSTLHCKCLFLGAPPCSTNKSILPIFASLLPRVSAKHHYATMQLHAILLYWHLLAWFSTSVETKSANKASQQQRATWAAAAGNKHQPWQ